MTRVVRVRMYDVGFGDAFTISIEQSGATKTVLVDCGSIKQGRRPMSEVVKALIADLPRVGGNPRLDLIVATHRHKDHVSGFGQAAWSQVDVGEVWMPWTEHPTDPVAKRIRETQAAVALALQKQIGRLDSAGLRKLGLSVAHREIAANALSNAKAMHTLHHGFLDGGGVRRFLPTRSASTFSRRPTVLGRKTLVHVLGPTRDELVIRDMDPPSGQSYLAARAAAARGAGERRRSAPFHARWMRSASELRREPSLAHLALDDAWLAQVERSLEIDVFEALVQLEKAVNGTSLMLVFEIGGLCLLFPGDAQWGTWNAAMSHTGKRALLERTRFLKIGHHGSHNASPRRFVDELLPAEGDAMASVQPISQWPEIPREPLLAALAARHFAVARSDAIDAASDRFTRAPNGLWVEAEYVV